MNETCDLCPRSLGFQMDTSFNVGKGTNYFWNGQASDINRTCIGARTDLDNFCLHFNKNCWVTQ